MTGGSNVDKSSQTPVISIQCDWDDIIFSQNQEIWISCKFQGKEGIHSKLRNHGKGTLTSASKDFSIESFTQNSLKIKFDPTGHVYIFVPPLKTFSKIHKKKILSLSVADGGFGVSVCDEDKLLVWSSVTGDILRTLKGHVCSVYKCKFFPSGIVILTGGADMQLKIWSAETGDCPVTLVGHKGAINDFCIVDRGRNIISVSNDGTAKLWDCGKSNCLATIFESKDVLNSCAIDTLPNNIEPKRKEPLNDREIGTNNKLLIIGSEKGCVYGVAVFSREVLFKINMDSAVNVVLILNGKITAGCQSGKIEIYSIQDTKTPEKVIDESGSPVVSGSVYKDSGIVIGRNDGSVIYYDFLNYSDKRISLTGSDCDPITDISCTNHKVFTSCRDGKIRQYIIADLVSTLKSL